STQVFIYGTDNILPIINLESPQNNSEEAASSIINFQFNVTDANDISNCSLVINGAIDPDDITSNPTRNTTITISRVLSNGFYNWSINCTDIAGNTNKSKTRNLSINVQIPGEIFFETYSSNAASIYLNRTEEGTGYSNSATCRRDQSIEVIEAVTTQGIGKNGFLIKGLQPINFTGHFVNDKAPIITWRLYHDYDNGSGWVQLAQDGNDASGGTGTDVNDIASSVKNSTPAGDIYLNSSGRLRLTANIWYTTGGTSYTCYHYYDNGNSFVKLFGYVLGFLDANISSPLADPELIEGSNFNVSCDIRCDDGWCMNTKVYVQYKTPSTSWTDISTTGNLVLADGETNPQVIGDINLTQKINFSIKANTISRNNATRCRAESTYSNSTGAVNTTITIRDATYPTVSLNNPQNNSWESDGNVTFYYTPDDNHNV
ncbi:MAG: hypothetical protein KAQ85_06870, partial [Thermodesulfovibrionia bacterium]|nr:hypothetical protein [Thermodesulfovibrionia bacterium]